MIANAAFRSLCALLGSDPLLIQGAGGNVSLKEGGVLWVKASGTWLARADRENIFTPLSLSAIRDSLESGSEMPTAPSAGSLRPSVETPLHALLPQRLVLHLHLLDAILLSARPDARAALAERLAGLDWLPIPYARPGWPLVQTIRQALAKRSGAPELLVLQNHGVIMAGEDEAEIRSLLNRVQERLWLPPRPAPLADPAALEQANDAGWLIPPEPEIHAPALSGTGLALLSGQPLFPDWAVFLGGSALILKPGRKLSGGAAGFRDAAGREPLFAAVEGAGLLVSPSASPGARALLGALGRLSLRAPPGAAAAWRTLTESELADLRGWEAEAWRRSLDQAGSGA